MSDSDDDLFEKLEAELEQDGTFDYYRQKQILHYQDTIQQKQNLHQNFVFFFDEKDLLEKLKCKKEVNKNYVIVFINETFTACQVLVERLKETVRTSDGTYSIYIINASNSRFLVSKLDIKILPTMVAYVDGRQIAQHVGLQGLLTNAVDVNTLSNDRLGRLLLSYFPEEKYGSSDEDY